MFAAVEDKISSDRLVVCLLLANFTRMEMNCISRRAGLPNRNMLQNAILWKKFNKPELKLRYVLIVRKLIT